MLYFEPVHVPGAAGSPAEIIEHFKENLDVVNKSVEDVNARIAALWQQNADKVQLLYNTACYYAAVYDLRVVAGCGQGRALLLRRLGPGVGGGRGRGQGPRHPWAARHGGRTGIRR